MPLVPKNNVPAGAPKLYGTEGVKGTILFRERCMKLFKPNEYVTIRNIDSDDVYWQAVPQDGETEQFSEDGMQRHIYRDQPEQWYIPAGDVDVLIGANAYLALDVMYKQYAMHSTINRQGIGDKPGQRNFNLSDGSLHDNVLSLAFLGKATPSFGPTNEGFHTTQPQVTPITPTPQTDSDIPLPVSAPNGQPAPGVDTGDAFDGNVSATRTWPEPQQAKNKETVGAGTKR